MARTVRFEEVDEATGKFEKLPAGGYICKILEMVEDDANERVWMMFDIASGEHAGYFTKDSFHDDKPYTHRIMLSYKAGALPFLKHRISCISESNKGFDAEAAWNGDLTLFKDKRFGIVMGEEEYEANNGSIRTRPDWFHSTIVTTSEINNGDFKVPEFKKLESNSDSAYSENPYKTDNIPF